MAFEFTPEMNRISNQLWAVTSAVGGGLCFLALVVIGILWAHPKSRPHLDRVSFRIVCYALVANMFFGISSAVGGMLYGPSFLCGFSIFVLQLTLQVSSWLLFTIALNLMLVIVYRFNGQKMERYYVIGSCIICIILAVPPYAAGQYGWDPLEKVCWYTNHNQKERLAWQIGTQMAWTALTVVGEVVASVMVIFIMLRHQARLQGMFHAASSVSKITSTTGTGTTPQLLVANSFKKIILRVALYPLTSCIVNLLSIFTAIHSTAAKGIHKQEDYNILLLSDFLYGGRSIAYALLALSDPALLKAMRVFFFHLRYGPHAQYDSSTIKTRSRSNTVEQTQSYPAKQVEVHIELSTVKNYSPPVSSNDRKKTVRKSSMNSHQELASVESKAGNVYERDVNFLDLESGRGEEATQGDTGLSPPFRPGAARHSRGIDLEARARKEEERAFKKQI